MSIACRFAVPAVAADKIVQLAPGLASAEMIKGDGGIARLVDNPYSTQSYARIVIQKFRLDKKFGFELRIVPAGNTAASIAAVQSGGADLSIFNWLDIARMRTAGVQVLGIGPFLQLGADYFVVPASSTLKTIADFKGRRIGINSRSSINWMITVAAAQKIYNLDVERDAFVQEAAPNLLRGLLEQGQLDGSHIFNNLTPDLIVTGRFRIMFQIKDIVDQLGLPAAPFLLWGTDAKYASEHPGNVRAFLAAYREAVEILRTDDSAWVEHAKELRMTDEAIALMREEMRADTWSRFTPQNEADIRRTFNVLASIVGPKTLGITTVPDRIMTLEYQ